MNILHVIPGLKQASGPTAFCVNICDQLADEQTLVAILHGGKIDGSCCLPRNQRIEYLGTAKREMTPVISALQRTLDEKVSHEVPVRFVRVDEIPHDRGKLRFVVREV